MPPTVEEITRALSMPFDPTEVKWKPQVVSGSRCMAICYVDARLIQDRLDEVLGVDGWQDHYEFIADGSCLCKLSIRFGDTWITKSDIGGQSEQKDGGDRAKSAVSDALKRAAVKFGIGRYLYRMPQTWVDYDPKTKTITKPPALPSWALPGRRPDVTAAPPQPPKQLPATKAKPVADAMEQPHDTDNDPAEIVGDTASLHHLVALGVRLGLPPDKVLAQVKRYHPNVPSLPEMTYEQLWDTRGRMYAALESNKHNRGA